VKEPAVRRAEAPKGCGSESIGEKVGVRAIGAAIARVLSDNRPHDIRLVGPVAIADKRHIAVGLGNADWKPTGEAGDSRKIPPLRQALRRAPERTVEGDGPVVTRHEIVRDVGGRQSLAETIIQKFTQSPKAEALSSALEKV